MERSSLRRLGLGVAVALGLGSCASDVASSVASSVASGRATTIEAVSCGMFPAFGAGDRLHVDPDLGDIRRGDIVSHRMGDPGESGPELYVHRVVGLPGERLEANSEGRILLNGTALVEDYLPAGTFTDFVDPVDIPADHYFVLGDNRARSSDSRVAGPLPRSHIVGRITKVVPIDNDEDDVCR